MEKSHPEAQRHFQTTLKVTWPFVLMVLLLLACSCASLYVLSTVRAFVAGESLWSKGQKDAIYYLGRYAHSGQASDLTQFQAALDIPLGDRAARQTLHSNDVHLDVAREGLVRGKNHPDDIENLIILLRYFQDFAIMHKPVQKWLIGDKYIDAMRNLAQEIHQHIKSGTVDDAQRTRWMDSLRDINEKVTISSIEFSEALGDSSRRIVQFLMWTNASIALILIALTFWHTRTLLVQRSLAEKNLSVERQQARTTLAAIGDGVITTNLQAQVIFMNPAAERLLARTPPAAAPPPIEDILELEKDSSLQSARELIQSILQNPQQRAVTATHRNIVRSDRSRVSVNLVGSAMTHQGMLTGVVLVLHDVTREQRYVKQLSWQASHDALTGLFNRREFERRLEALLVQSGTDHQENSLLFIDLDHFKLINDTCGHQAGDEMLREVCRTLQAQLRECDTLARLGGDEFGVLLRNCRLGTAVKIAEKLRMAVQSMRLTWEGRELSTTLSIGMVPLIPAFKSIQEAMRMADMACYRAKEAGRNQLFVRQPEDVEMDHREGQMDWVHRLRLALKTHRFELYAQKIVALQDTQDSGLHLEILLRLRDEDDQLVQPGTFIPAAEKYGMMPAIDRWVISQTLAVLSRHLSTPKVAPISTCAINLSGDSLGDQSLLPFIRKAILESGIDPRMLCFEITETAAISRITIAKHMMQELGQLGCQFALDDFGVGMSSFNYLKHLPVSSLKIDGTFVKDMLQDPHNNAMVEMINHIGHMMGKKTIAEYVETPAIMQTLTAMGLDFAQGYAIAKPTPLQEFLKDESATFNACHCATAAHSPTNAMARTA